MQFESYSKIIRIQKKIKNYLLSSQSFPKRIKYTFWKFEFKVLSKFVVKKTKKTWLFAEKWQGNQYQKNREHTTMLN